MVRSGLTSLMALGLAPVLGKAAAVEDIQALVQHELRTRRISTNSSGSCECLGWKAAYAAGAKCGDGRELDIAAGVPGPKAARSPQLAFEFCQMYFANLPDENYCMNNKFAQEPMQWCYVSGGCAEGTPTQRPGPLKVKTCSQGQDTLLGQMKFQDFAAHAYKNKLEMGLMVQYAYPTWAGEKLPDVQAFWGLPEPAHAKPMTPELKQRLQALADSGKTMFFTSRNGHPPFGVVEGKRLYYINFNPKGNPGFKKKEDMNSWGCVGGCGVENRPLW